MICMRARTSSNFGLIGPLTAELNALERLKNPHRLIMGKMMSSLFLGCFYLILFILAGNDNIHESLDKFEIRPDQTTCFLGNRLGYDGEMVLPLFLGCFSSVPFHICG